MAKASYHCVLFKGDEDEAVKAYQRAIDLDPTFNHGELHFNLGVSYKAQGTCNHELIILKVATRKSELASITSFRKDFGCS